jgi:hypothetical protein
MFDHGIQDLTDACSRVDIMYGKIYVRSSVIGNSFVEIISVVLCIPYVRLEERYVGWECCELAVCSIHLYLNM